MNTMKQNNKLLEVWGLRLLSLVIAIVIALVFYVRFYQTFLGDWHSAACAALAVSVGSVVVTGYAIHSFNLDFSKGRNRVIFATLWLFAIGLFLFDRATETYTMQHRKTKIETDSTNLKMLAIDKMPILQQRLTAITDANKRLAMLEYREKETGLLYVTLRREAQHERRLADSLYQAEKNRQMAIVQRQSDEIKTAGIESNGLGFVVKNWPSAALGLVVLGLLVAAYWKESDAAGMDVASGQNGGERRQASPNFILPEPIPGESKREYSFRIAQMFAQKQFPEYVNQSYLAQHLKIREGTMSKLVHGKLGKSILSKRKTLETA